MNNDKRLEQLKIWLHSALNSDQYELTVASADASFRRYFRVLHDGKTMIVMDAPPEKEDCKPFVDIATRLRANGINTPKILAEDHEQGFLLLSDLGDIQYLSVLSTDSVTDLYKDAINTLIKMQSTSTQSIPTYNRELLQTEMQLFPDWFLNKHLDIHLNDEQNTRLNTAFECLTENALQQPSVFVHRDYHSRNLMQTDKHNPGVLDFQDAVSGAITYDLASLLKDCYIAWPRQQIENWVRYYLQQAHQQQLIDNHFQFDDVMKWVDLMAVQRHLKAIGIFARLNIRDNKPGYLNDIPRTFQYIIDSCERYELLKPLRSLLKELDVASRLKLEWKPLP